MSTFLSNIKLGELIDTQKGYAFKSKWYSENGTNIVKVSDFTYDSIDSSDLVCIPDEIAKDYNKYMLDLDDVIVQTVGSWPSNPASVVGKVVRVPSDVKGALLNQNAVKLIPDERIDKKYLFYLLKSPNFKGYIINTAQGAASQASITLDSIRHFKFDLPDLKTQKEIATTLSAFDDLIENNTRRIEILEEMARLIYREWFVHYRYPGHEIDKLVDSGKDLGKIPEGWAVTEAQDIIDFNPRTSIDKEKSRPYLPMGNVSENSMVIDDTDLENRTGSSGTKFQNNDTLFARITPSLENGKTGFVQFLKENEIALGSTEFIVMRSKKVNPYYVYCLARDDKFRETAIKSMAGASGRQRVRVNTIKEFSLPLPADNLLNEFQEIAKPMFQQVHTLTIQNKKLKATRDLILPKLISGHLAL